jgi:hypothetical protein
VLQAIARLEQVLDLETAALVERRHVDLGDTNMRKNQGLLELTRAARGVEGGEAAAPELGSRIRSLRAKLDRNKAVLEVHLRAAQEVSGLLAEAMRDLEADGTYSLGAAAAGRRRW